MTATHDLFLSYRRADGPAVAPLLAALQSRGVRVWRDENEVDDFASIQRSVETGLARPVRVRCWPGVRSAKPAGRGGCTHVVWRAASARWGRRIRIRRSPGNG
jgi:hypothetical protein